MIALVRSRRVPLLADLGCLDNLLPCAVDPLGWSARARAAQPNALPLVAAASQPHATGFSLSSFDGTWDRTCVSGAIALRAFGAQAAAFPGLARRGPRLRIHDLLELCQRRADRLGSAPRHGILD